MTGPQEKESSKKEADWLQLSLAGPVPALDAFADFLYGLGAKGSIFSDDPKKRNDIQVITSFLSKDNDIEENLKSIELFLDNLRQLWPEESIGELDANAVIEKDWLEEWRKTFKPVKVGSRIWIVPTWLEPPGETREKGMIRIRLDPGMAFGTGIHATTRACLCMIEELVPRGCRSVLDVGTGTGILAMAAAKLGAGRVVAIDVDPEAVKTARENIRKNRLSSRIKLKKMRADVGIKTGWKKFELILANIFAQELIRILAFLDNLLQDKAKLILAGILKEQEEDVKEACLASGFSLLERLEDQGWITLIVTKR